MHREDAVLVAGEFGELPHVVPHPLVGGVEQVRAVLVHLDAGLRLGLGVGVAADVRAAVEHQDALVQLGGHAFGDRQAEESGADDEEVEAAGGLGRSDPGVGAVIGSKGIRPRCVVTRMRARPVASDGRSQFAHDSASSL